MWWDREQDIRIRLILIPFHGKTDKAEKNLNIKACHTSCHCPCQIYDCSHRVLYSWLVDNLLLKKHLSKA